ncbi:hypothetical protein GJAV_G00261450 [Gymnothorax javanicus]|nr:hypothetical protein GJAV_G00261450 [Gymnothorax javanicus]
MSSSGGEEEREFGGIVEPYQDELLAPPEAIAEEARQADLDGLTPEQLAQREEGAIRLDEWCQCTRCRTEELSGALEYHCCREVVQTQGKMYFDGSIERLSCITEHEGYAAMTNRAVLENVGPLLKDRNGRSYRRRAGVYQ